jgi:small GTP-binding protein
MSYDYLFKYILLGESTVGKTSLLNRLILNNYNTFYDETIGVDFRSYMTTIRNDIVIKSHLWDTAGTQSFTNIIKPFYKNIAGAIIVYDISNRYSFDRVSHWKDNICKYRISTDPLTILLIGNKLDTLSRCVSRTEAETYAIENKFLYAESSCKHDLNITESFEWLINETYKTMNNVLPGLGVQRSVIYNNDIIQPVFSETLSTHKCIPCVIC